MLGAPVRPARVADVVAEQQRLQPEARRVEILEGVFPRPGEIADGFIGDRGNVHGREIAGAGEPGQRQRVTFVRLDAITGLPRNQGGRATTKQVSAFFVRYR